MLEKIIEGFLKNWHTIIVIIIVLILGISIITYEPEECKEFDLVDKIEKSEVHNDYIIYYSDGRIEDSYFIPACIKLNK